MVRTASHTPKLTKKFYPMVSVCTPTFNRRPFIQAMLECFRNQTYPKDRMEWIIIDDGTDPINDLIDAAKIPQIRYFREERKMALGEKRNYMHSKVKGTIVVYMDDDDYYPPERVTHAVDTLQANREALCAGASEIYVYFKHIHMMYQSGPYGPNHATAGTFAFRVELLKNHRYDDHAALAEEKNFLKDYTVPFVQLDPLKTILVFSHNHNTFDKKRLLENAHPQFFKPSQRTVDEFIRQPKEAVIKQFFMTDIDKALAEYAPGEPSMKPDVLKQIREIDEERKGLQQQQGGGQIMINEPGKEPRPMTPQEILQAINGQTEEIKALREKNGTLETMVANLQKTISKLNHLLEQTSKLSDTNSMNNEKSLKETINHGREPSITSLSPTVSHQSSSDGLERFISTSSMLKGVNPQDTFLDTLLKKIDVLEKRNKELEKGIPPIPPVEEINQVRSKSMPEVMVDISI
jgi:Glycosyl transferase family 2